MLPRKIAVAPMMGWTDKHFRHMLRLMTQHTLLYTEMLTTGAIIHGDSHKFLALPSDQSPLALQLGGSDPAALTKAIQIAEPYGYDEYNLNVGCPSPRVQSGAFGACLMKTPKQVADCVAAMRDATDKVVTVKMRLGVDEYDHYQQVADFVKTVHEQGGCEIFIVHARKAWLKGLSPKQNREKPPLRYPWVLQLQQDFPQCQFVLNGGLKDIQQAKQWCDSLTGVMIGRLAYEDPYCFAIADQHYYADSRPVLSREMLVEKMIIYMQQQVLQGTALNRITRHLLQLYQGQPGAKAWRQQLTVATAQRHAKPDIVNQALLVVKQIQERFINV